MMTITLLMDPYMALLTLFSQDRELGATFISILMRGGPTPVRVSL